MMHPIPQNGLIASEITRVVVTGRIKPGRHGLRCADPGYGAFQLPFNTSPSIYPCPVGHQVVAEPTTHSRRNQKPPFGLMPHQTTQA